MEEKLKQSSPTLHKYLFTVTTFSKLLAMTLFILLPFVGFYLGMKYQEKINIPVVSQVQTIVPQQTQTNCNEDLRLPEAIKTLNGNQAALEIAIKNCLLVESSFSTDLQNIGKKDFIFWGVGAGCGSCHAKYFYVLSDNKIIFQKDLDDPTIGTEVIGSKNALVITEPIRKQNEALSSPTSELKTWYLWDNSAETFQVLKKLVQKVKYP